MIIEFKGNIFYWRDVAIFLFVAVSEEPSRDLKAISAIFTFGWGLIPTTEWKTSLFPKEVRYLVPIRMSAQKSENGERLIIELDYSHNCFYGPDFLMQIFKETGCLMSNSWLPYKISPTILQHD